MIDMEECIMVTDETMQETCGKLRPGTDEDELIIFESDYVILWQHTSPNLKEEYCSKTTEYKISSSSQQQPLESNSPFQGSPIFQGQIKSLLKLHIVWRI